MIEYRPGADRFVTRAEGRTTWHSFSFGAHYDPGNVGFGRLVAHNDERLPPGTGYDDHPHADLEIVTWVLSGALRHTSTVGSGVIGPGQVQRLSAGSGVVHSEVADGPEETRFLQAWVRPDEPGLEPDYRQRRHRDRRRLDDGRGRAAAYPSPRQVRRCTWPTCRRDSGSTSRTRRGCTCSWRRGQVMLGERLLEPDDAARLRDEAGRPVTAETDSHLVVWSFRA